MIFQTYIQNLSTIGLVVQETTCLIKIDTAARQTHGNGRSLFSYSRGYEASENMKGASYPMDSFRNTLPYAGEVKSVDKYDCLYFLRDSYRAYSTVW